MTSHELFTAISPALAMDMLEQTHATDKPLYRAALNALAQFRKVRLVFLERQPRKERNAALIQALKLPPLELAAESLIRSWLVKNQSALLADFLDALKISHEKGVVETVPSSVPDDALRGAVEHILSRHPSEIVAVYLHSFHSMNEPRWTNLETLLQNEPRLALGRAN